MIIFEKFTKTDKEIIDDSYLGNVVIDDKENYQALYASQDFGTFYMLYAKFTFYEASKKIKKIDFKIINYKKILGVKIGFTENAIKKEYFRKKKYNIRSAENSFWAFKFKLPIKRLGRSFDTTFVEFPEDEDYDMSNVDFCYIKKFYVKKNTILNDVFDFPDTNNRRKAFGGNCEQSIIKIIK